MLTRQFLLFSELRNSLLIVNTPHRNPLFHSIVRAKIFRVQKAGRVLWRTKYCLIYDPVKIVFIEDIWPICFDNYVHFLLVTNE